jgi:hypothetical protein
MAGADDAVTIDTLTAAVVEAARDAANGRWGGPPRLYALATHSSLAQYDVSLPAQVAAAAPGALIPIEQDPLPAGNAVDVLAQISWPPAVPGCVLVTDVLIDGELPPGDAGRDGDPGAERQARLTVGVLREGESAAQYACCLQRRGSDELIVNPDMADDLVAALLGTF